MAGIIDKKAESLLLPDVFLKTIPENSVVGQINENSGRHDGKKRTPFRE